MPSKRSKSLKQASSPSNLERVCSESELPGLAEELLARAGSAAWVFLEGELGAGKSALASHILRKLGHATGGEGSPTFPLAHEYLLGGRRVAHLDLYRLKSEDELEMAGLLEHFTGETAIVLVEWASLFPDLFARLRTTVIDRRISVVDVQIEFAQEAESETDRRRFKICSSTASVHRDTASRRRS